jgi:hypothetical protein
VLATRRAKLTFKPGNPNLPGNGQLERGPYRIPIALAQLVPRLATAGLSLHHTCSLALEDDAFLLDSMELVEKTLEANLKNCKFEVADGRYLVMHDAAKTERIVDLFKLGSKFDTRDPLMFLQFRDRVLKWAPPTERFGPPPLPREVSPEGLPAFIERRIRPADFVQSLKATNVVWEPLVDKDGTRCDLIYTCESAASIVYVDPDKPAFKDIPNANAARPLYYADGGQLPMYIEAKDSLVFPGRLPGIVECRVAIFLGRDVASLASEACRAAQLAAVGEVPQVTQTLSFYAFGTNSAALSPRPLAKEELALVRSRTAQLLKDTRNEGGQDLNLHFDLPWEPPKGTLRVRN